MGAPARVVVYTVANGEIVRTGLVPAGRESQQANPPAEGYLGEAQIEAALVGLAGPLGPSVHFLDVDQGYIVRSRAFMGVLLNNTTVLANGIQTLICTNLAVPASNPSVAATTIRVVGPGVDVTTTSSSGTASFTFDTAGTYTLTFDAYPKYLTQTLTVIASAYANVTGVSSTGSAGTIWAAGASFATPILGLSATGAVGTIWAAGSSFGAPVIGVSGTGSITGVSKSIAKTPTGVSSTGSVGTVGKSNAKPITGVNATGTAADAPQTSITATVVGDFATGATVSPFAEFGVNLPSASATGTIGVVTKMIAMTAASVTATGTEGQIGANLSVDVTGVAATGTTDGL